MFFLPKKKKRIHTLHSMVLMLLFLQVDIKRWPFETSVVFPSLRGSVAGNYST